MSASTTPINRTYNKFIQAQVDAEKWRPDVIPADVVGLRRDVRVFFATRKTNLIDHQYHGDKDTFCPPQWSDLCIGSGACGLGCRACFLMLTHRSMRDALQPDDFEREVLKWLADKRRRRQHTLGFAIDRCDSLLYEGALGHVRKLAPHFANTITNPNRNQAILLTKSKNVHWLEKLRRENVVVTFSLNPESIADLWEGKWPDNGERITPPIIERLEACLNAQRWGFEVRWRIDPILNPPGWEKEYAEFFKEAAAMGVRPRYLARKNGLPEMEWEPQTLEREGTHFHVPDAERIRIYRVVTDLSRCYLPESRVSLCKETHKVRKAVQLCNADCNCLN